MVTETRIGKWPLSGLRQELRGSRARIEGYFQPTGLRWNTYWSGIDSYDRSFGPALSCGLVDFLARKEHAVVIDLLSSPAALRDLALRLGGRTTIRGLSVSLEDHRGGNQVRSDEAMDLTHITGDLTRKSTWASIEETLGGKKVDLILERGVAGIGIFPTHPAFQLYIVGRVWRLLNEDEGTLLAQISTDDYSSESEWVAWIQRQGIDVSLHPEGIVYFYRILKVIRHPSNLPELPTPALLT